MATNIYVGNLPFRATEDEIRALFSAYGAVESVHLMTDRETGRLRGFGFVEMASGGREAMAVLDQTELHGRRLKVNEARPREARPQREPRWEPPRRAVWEPGGSLPCPGDREHHTAPGNTDCIGELRKQLPPLPLSCIGRCVENLRAEPETPRAYNAPGMVLNGDV